MGDFARCHIHSFTKEGSGSMQKSGDTLTSGEACTRFRLRQWHPARVLTGQVQVQAALYCPHKKQWAGVCRLEGAHPLFPALEKLCSFQQSCKAPQAGWPWCSGLRPRLMLGLAHPGPGAPSPQANTLCSQTVCPLGSC